MTWWSSDLPATGAVAPDAWSWSVLDEPHEEPRQEAVPEELGCSAEEASLHESRGYERGLADGIAAGEARAADALSRAVEAAREAARQVEDARESLSAELRDDVLAVALAVARHIVGRELEGDGEAFADLVREALNAFPLDHKVKIRLNPADLSRISAAPAPGGDAPRISGGRDVQWIADADIAEGGCVVEGPERVLDGRLDHVMERIFERLRHA